MQQTHFVLRTCGILAVLGIATLALPCSAQAGVRVSIGIGVPVYPAPVVVAPPPAVVYPAPVIVTRPPVVVAPPPVVYYGSPPVFIGGSYGYQHHHWRHHHHHHHWRRW
jgi:hypothetical protein